MKEIHIRFIVTWFNDRSGRLSAHVQSDNEEFVIVQWTLKTDTTYETSYVWQHYIPGSEEKSGDVHDLTEMSEEELFQYDLVHDLSDPNKIKAVQKYVHQNFYSFMQDEKFSIHQTRLQYD